MLPYLLLTLFLKQQEQLRDENKKLSTTATSEPPASTSSDNPSTSTVTGACGTRLVTSAAGTTRRPSSDSGLASDSRGISDSSASRTEGVGPSSEQNRDSASGTGSGTQASGKSGFRLDMRYARPLKWRGVGTCSFLKPDFVTVMS